MKIAFFTEMNWSGKTLRNHTNMRTEFAWFTALNATHYNIGMIGNETLPNYDIGVVIIPKNYEPFQISELRKNCTKIGFMQEGPSWYFQDLSVDKQIDFYNQMCEVDFVWCHNEVDKEYYEGLLNKPTYINPTLMIEDLVKTNLKEKQNKVIIGGNFVHWYGGFNSYMIAGLFDVPIWAPSMGKRAEDENKLDGISFLPYLDWNNWITALSEFKYAVHLIPNTIGGTFSLNCAYLGIPCIGNKYSNTQQKCFPDLSVEPHDLKSASNLVENLKDDSFYEEMSMNAKLNYTKHFSEETYLKYMNKVFGSL